MKKINTDDIVVWCVAKKVKRIKAKPLISILVEKSVTSKFLVDTLEGKEILGDGAIICVGESNDVWQQMPKKLLQKYSVVEIDNDGWMVCEPKPDNSIECVEITPLISECFDPAHMWVTPEEFFIIGQWGESIYVLDKEIVIQKADYGDFICRNREDKTDIWIVKRKIFKNTYAIIGE